MNRRINTFNVNNHIQTNLFYKNTSQWIFFFPYVTQTLVFFPAFTKMALLILFTSAISFSVFLQLIPHVILFDYAL